MTRPADRSASSPDSRRPPYLSWARQHRVLTVLLPVLLIAVVIGVVLAGTSGGKSASRPARGAAPTAPPIPWATASWATRFPDSPSRIRASPRGRASRRRPIPSWEIDVSIQSLRKGPSDAARHRRKTGSNGFTTRCTERTFCCTHTLTRDLFQVRFPRTARAWLPTHRAAGGCEHFTATLPSPHAASPPKAHSETPEKASSRGSVFPTRRTTSAW